MLPKNPFNSLYSEMIDSNQTFLSLFDESHISKTNDEGETFITEEMFSKTVFFSSALGGGKSSTFHFFSPGVLETIVQSKEEYFDCYTLLEQLNIIKGGKNRLLGINISLARNYEVIDDIYDNGKRKQAFFSLLNVRVLKEALKSILEFNHANIDALSLITFAEIPEELSGEFKSNWTGKDYYEWACREENLICEELNDLGDLRAIHFIHNYLSVIQLFEANNLRFNGLPFAEKTLFLFDDIHRLTQHQKQALRESLFVVRARVGVWLAQRTYGLDDKEVLGLDGTYGRDYLTRRFEDYYQKSSKTDKAFQTIADRRAKAAQDITVTTFQSCIAESIDWERDKECKNKLENASIKLENFLTTYLLPEEIEKLKSQSQTLIDLAITYRTAKIFIDRKLNHQQLTLEAFFLAPSEDELTKAIKDNSLRAIARYYLCIENDLPFYFGMQKLYSLAFNNVYQFLSFSGAIFERRLSYRYRAKKNVAVIVSAAEQDRIVHNVAKKKWEELSVNFYNSERIQSFLLNIARVGIITRDYGTASYSGGTFTGIGIKADLFGELVKENSEIKSILSQCVSNNLLRKLEIKQGSKDENVVVFYLNRWICTFFNLPLAYGGWKSCGKELFTHICLDSNKTFIQHYPDYSGGESE